MRIGGEGEHRQRISRQYRVCIWYVVPVSLRANRGSTYLQRRRAQNRASQRAFRERKEKHAQDLQRQLDELETRHKALQGSYNELGSTNKKLADELDVLRNRISVAQASHDLAENSPSMKTPLGPDGELDKKNVTEVED